MALYILNAEVEPGRAALIEQRLRDVITGLIKIDNLEDVEHNAASSNEPVKVLVITPAQDSTYVARFLHFGTQHSEQAFFILVGDEITATQYKALLRTGVADWVSINSDMREILEIVSRSQTRGRDADPPRAPGRKAVVASLVSSAGGVGNATIAVEAAIQLKKGKTTRAREICIVDLDFQKSHICDYLDIEPRLKIQEISSNPDRLDAHLFEIFISRHSSGLHVFAAPRSEFDCCGLDIAALDRFFDMASTRYDLIIIDIPATWFSWTRQIISASDGAIIVGLNTIPGLRLMIETLATVREAAQPSTSISLVVNRCKRRLIGGIARQSHVEKILGYDNVRYVAEEPMALESINAGAPMALTNSYRAAAKDIADIAGFFADLKRSQVAVAQA